MSLFFCNEPKLYGLVYKDRISIDFHVLICYIISIREYSNTPLRTACYSRLIGFNVWTRLQQVPLLSLD